MQMDWDEFRKMIGDITRYWDRTVSQETGKQWFDTIGGELRKGNGPAIYQKFTLMDTRPVNIPKRIREISKGLQSSPAQHTDFLISMLMRHSEQYNISPLQAFYELREPIKKHKTDMRAALVWLKSKGFVVDWEKFNEPSAVDFGAFIAILENPKRVEMKEPQLLGDVFDRPKEVTRMREPGEDDE